MTSRFILARESGRRAALRRAERAARMAEALGTPGALRYAARVRAEAGEPTSAAVSTRLGRHGRACDDGPRTPRGAPPRADGARIERKTVAGYPAPHNPYLPHTPAADCFAGCRHAAEAPR